MTKNELIQYSVEEVRKNTHLYSEFLRMFKEENGKGCTSCKFKQIFSSWQREQNQPKNINTMANNTFILRDSNARYRVNESEILSSKASDEIALKWLALESYGGNATKVENLEKVFKVLPEGYKNDESDFSKMKKEDLKLIAEEKEYPSAEWKMLNVEPLREYLSNKASEAKTAQEEVAETTTDPAAGTDTEETTTEIV